MDLALGKHDPILFPAPSNAFWAISLSKFSAEVEF